MLTVNQFRLNYPEFSSTTLFPASQVNYWIGIAYSFLNANRWGQQLEFGVELYTAHNLSLEGRAKLDAQNNGIPGMSPGMVIAKTVGQVGIKYDNKPSQETDGGHWNLTIYGVRFLRIAKLMGAGPIQVGRSRLPPNSGPGWSGPDVFSGFTSFG